MTLEGQRSNLFKLGGLTLAVWLSVSFARAEESGRGGSQRGGQGGEIGAITSVQGKVLVDHPDPDAPFLAKTTDNLQFNDVIETHGQSRTRMLLHSEGVLTVGENSRVEIVEHEHDQARPERSVTVRLVQGSLRAFVGSAFATAGSKFEVRTPMASAIAHGGTFVVWVDKNTSGVANIGTSGAIEFTSGGQTARLAPGEYSHAPAGSIPVPAALIEAGAHPSVHQTIAATDLKESLRHEAPRDALREIGAPRAIGLGLGGVGVAGGESAAADQGKAPDQSAGVDAAQGGGESASSTSQTQPKHHAGTPNPNRTPPSVHSGAADRLLRPHESGPLRGEGRIRR
jgi:hypothetical protein